MFRTASFLKLNLTIHTKPSNLALKPFTSITALNPISTSVRFVKKTAGVADGEH